MKRLHPTQLTITPELLENTTPARPNGAIHVALAREYALQEEAGEAVYTLDNGDAVILRADLVQRARDLWRDCMSYLANENRLPVKVSPKPEVALTLPVEVAPVEEPAAKVESP